MSILLKGIMIGITIAAPVGPIGIFCIQSTLKYGKRYGFMSGLGAATADTIYGMVAALGLTFISQLITEQNMWFRLFGGLFCLYIGISASFSKTQCVDKCTNKKFNHGLNLYFKTFLLTLTNPITILAFSALFAGWGLVDHSNHYFSVIFLVLGVFIGSGIWWAFLSTIAGFMRNRFPKKWLATLNWISGAAISVLGLLLVVSVLLKFVHIFYPLK